MIIINVWAFLVRCGLSPPIPPRPNLMGGDKSRGIYRKSRGISPEGRGGTNPEASKNLKRKPWERQEEVRQVKKEKIVNLEELAMWGINLSGVDGETLHWQEGSSR